MSTDLFLYDEKGGGSPASALGLRDGLGFKTLTSLDSTCYYLENLEKSKAILIKIMPQMKASDLILLCQQNGLPPVAMERIVYHDCLIQLVQALDLTRRINQYLDQHTVQHIHYTGKTHWKWHVLFSICKHRDIKFSYRQGILSRSKEFLTKMRDGLQRFRYRLMRSDHLQEKCNFLFFIPIARLARGLPSIMSELGKDSRVQAIEANEQSILNGIATVRLQSFSNSSYPKRTNIEQVLADVQWVDEVSGVLEGAVKEIILDTISDVFLWVTCVNRILKSCPDAVVIGTFVGEPILEVARALKYRTAVIQTCGTVEYAVHLVGESTYLLASEKDQERLLKESDQLRSVICGHSGYDFPKEKDQQKRDEVRKQYGVEHDKLIVFAGSYVAPGLIEWESIAKRTQIFLDGVKDLADVKIIIKLHPYEHRIEAYEDMLLSVGLRHKTVITQTANINHVLQAADVVVMLESTVGQESIVLDKPLLDIPALGDWYGYHACGAALVAHDAEEVKNHLFRMLYHDEVQQQLSAGRQCYLDSYFPMQDGQVVKRICEYLKTLQ